MTTLDSQTVVSLDTSEGSFGITKACNNKDTQVGALTVTSEEIEAPSSESERILAFIRKGNGSRPVSGGIKKSQTVKSKSDASKNNKSEPANSSSKKDSSSKTAANSSKTSQGSSKKK